MNRLFDAWSTIMRPPDRLDIETWCENYVKVQDSATGSPTFSLEMVPWLKEPLRAIENKDIREIVMLAAVGSGKTTLFEGFIPWAISEAPGGILAVMQSDKVASTWAETRLFPSLKTCEPLNDLYPTDRHKIRKDEIMWPHMPLIVTGAGMGNLQFHSMRYVSIDEAWKLKLGRIEEAKARTHRRWNSKILICSQGGLDHESSWSDEQGNPDLDKEWRLTDQSIYSWICEDCDSRNPWVWNDFRYNEGVTEGSSEIDLEEVRSGVTMVCPNCGKVHKDDPKTRRKLSTDSIYVSTNDKPLKGRKGFNLPAMAIWWEDWGTIAVKWVLAQQAKRKGNLTPLRIFIQKQLAKPWKDDIGEKKVELIGSGYLKTDVANGDKIDNEYHRIMTVDVQSSGGRHFWVVIRAYRMDGTSKLVYESRIQTWQILEELSESYKVRPTLVFIDGQHETEEVKLWCGKNGWNILHGSKTNSYRHKVKLKGMKKAKTVTKNHSVRNVYHANSKAVKYWFLGTSSLKDILYNLMMGEGIEWEIPDDASKDYHKQMKGETKRDVVDKETKRLVKKWVKTNENHLFDCEVMNLGAAMIVGIIKDFTIDEE